MPTPRARLGGGACRAHRALRPGDRAAAETPGEAHAPGLAAALCACAERGASGRGRWKASDPGCLPAGEVLLSGQVGGTTWCSLVLPLGVGCTN